MAFTNTSPSVWAAFQEETAAPSKTSGVGVDCAVGNLVILVVAFDNIATTDGSTSTLTGVTDTKSNTWVKAGEFTNTLGGAAADGAAIAIWYCNVTTAILSGVDLFTIRWSASVAAKAIIGLLFTKNVSSTIGIGGTVQTLANDNSDAGAMTISGLTSQEYLFLRAIASETDNNAWNANTSSYTAFQDRSGTGGSEKGHISLNLEFIILTGTSSTSDPTMTDATADRASLFVALYEISGTPSRTPRPTSIGHPFIM